MTEYLSENLWQVWGVIAVLGLILELSSGDFFIMCFAIGAVGAAIAAPFTTFYVQLAVFGIVTALSIFQVRPFALRYLHRDEQKRVSNAEALIGRVGRVDAPIVKGRAGYVAIDGDVWKAVNREAADIPVGTRVRVVARESTVLTVEAMSE